jgi:hypothetical protein
MRDRAPTAIDSLQLVADLETVFDTLRLLQQLRILVAAGKNFPPGEVYCTVRCGTEAKSTAPSVSLDWNTVFSLYGIAHVS